MDERSIVVKTEVRADVETLDGLEADVAVAEETPHGEAVVAVLIELAEWVLTVGHTTDRATEGHTVLLIHRNGRRHLERVLERLAIHLVAIGKGEVLAHADNLIDVVGAVHADSDVLKVGVLQDTVGLLVAYAEHLGALVGTVADGDVVALGEAGAADSVEPVGVAEDHGLIVVDVTIVETTNGEVDILTGNWIVSGDGHAIGGIEIQTVVLSVDDRIEAIVEGGLSHGGSILISVAELHLRLAVVERSLSGSGEVNLYLLVLLAALGGDDDDTIGSAATVDRGRSGVLQNLHRLDVVHVKGVEGRSGGHTIDNVERILVGVERTNTTDADGSGGSRRTIGSDGHTGNLTLEGAHRVGVARGLEALGLHNSNRTGEVGLTLSGITGDHNFFEQLVILGEDHVHVGSSCEDLCHITHEAELELCARLDLQREVTVEVGDRTIRGTYFNY